MASRSEHAARDACIRMLRCFERVRARVPVSCPSRAIRSAEWCGPCRLTAPTFEAAAHERRDRKGVQFVKADSEQCLLIIRGPMLSAGYQIEALPAIVILDYTGKPLAHMEGKFNRDELEAFLKENKI